MADKRNRVHDCHNISGNLIWNMFISIVRGLWGWRENLCSGQDETKLQKAPRPDGQDEEDEDLVTGNFVVFEPVEELDYVRSCAYVDEE